MTHRIRSRTFVALALACVAVPLIAAPTPAASNIARTRDHGFHALGKAFKNAMDALRGGQPNMIAVQRAAGTIKATSQAQYQWFPAGSGPQRGLKTAAKAEIWTKPVEFRAAQDKFASEADGFQRAAMSGNADAIRAAARTLGGACKGCHDQFRVPEDH